EPADPTRRPRDRDARPVQRPTERERAERGEARAGGRRPRLDREVAGDRREMAGADGDAFGPPTAARPRGDGGPAGRARAVERRPGGHTPAGPPRDAPPRPPPVRRALERATFAPVQRAGPDLDDGFVRLAVGFVDLPQL